MPEKSESAKLVILECSLTPEGVWLAQEELISAQSEVRGAAESTRHRHAKSSSLLILSQQRVKMLMKGVLTRETVAVKMEFTSEGSASTRPTVPQSRQRLMMDAVASLRLATFAPAIPRFATTVIVEIIFMLLTLSFIICVLKRK